MVCWRTCTCVCTCVYSKSLVPPCRDLGLYLPSQQEQLNLHTVHLSWSLDHCSAQGLAASLMMVRIKQLSTPQLQPHQPVITKILLQSAPQLQPQLPPATLSPPPPPPPQDPATIPAIATTSNLQHSQDQPASDHEETAYDKIPATATTSNLQPPASSTPTTVSTTGQSTAIGLPSSARLSELKVIKLLQMKFCKENCCRDIH